MKNYRNSLGKRICSLLLSAMLIIGMLPASIFAESGGSFILVAEGEGKLAIAPTYVHYKAGQTVKAALAGSGYSFVGLDTGSVTEINGVVGNYYRGDQNGNYTLGSPAADVQFYRFCEDEENKFTEGLKELMTAMAIYQTKPMDVQGAAKAAYDTACAQFVGIGSESASLLAAELTDAMEIYEEAQKTTFSVTFGEDSSPLAGAVIKVENPYGKTWTDENKDGKLNLPAGTYHFRVSKDDNHAEGDFEVKGASWISLSMPKNPWVDLSETGFRLSGSCNNSTTKSKFENDEFELGSWNGRTVKVAVKDTFTGTVYAYIQDLAAANLSGELPKVTAIYTSVKTGEQVEKEQPLESYTTGISGALKRGAEGNTVIYRISSKANNGYLYSQDYKVKFERTPTLKGITVKNQDGIAQAAMTAFDGDVTDYTYKVLDTVTKVTVEPQPLMDNYEVKIKANGTSVSKGASIAVSGNTNISVEVSSGDYTNTYKLHIQPGEGREVIFEADSDISLEVVNEENQVMPCDFRLDGDKVLHLYTLVPGQKYNYVATKDGHYHSRNVVKAEDANETINVKVEDEDWLTALSFGTSSAVSSKNNLPMDSAFESSDHEYVVKLFDTEHIPYVWLDAKDNVDVEAVYVMKFAAELYHDKEEILELTSGKKNGTAIDTFLMYKNPIENVVTIRLSKVADGVTYYQDYDVEFQRKLTLQDVSANCEGRKATLVRENGKTGFDPETTEYNVTVSMAARSLDINVERYTENKCYGEDEVGYRVSVDGKDVTETGTATVALDGSLETQNVTVTVKNDKAPGGTTKYIIHVLKSPPVEASFDVTPGNALIAMYETLSGERLWPNEDGAFQLCEGYSYRYAATAYGYVGKTGVLEVTRDETTKNLIVKDASKSYAVTGNDSGGGELTIQWSLTKAAANTEIPTDITSEWNNFRGNSNNNAITDAKIPTAAEDGTLYWANKIGDGFSSDAVGSPILVDGDLVTYAGNKIFRVDTVTGEIKATGTMDHKSAHATTPPSYAEGMVFVALTDGTVQAFNAETLESLWIYKDPLGGQPVCPLTIHDGYLYTGFWNSEKGDANFVCLSITDENPKTVKESKSASWYHTAAGGYYWAGAYVCDDFVMIGTDDGSSGFTSKTSAMLLFDPATGKLMDSWKGLNGDIRSTVVYDETTDAYYFTSKGGSFYSMQVVKSGTEWKLSNKWSVNLENGVGGTPMSTSSPTVYKGRAYVGVSGAGQFEAYSGHNITVIDLSSKSIAYRAETQGYPQTSGLLTTAYEQSSGYVYVYFFDNMTPGKLRVLRDKAGQKKADYMTTETIREGSYSTVYSLFTPTGDQAEYAICSPIVDQYGTVYFKNDSAHMMAFGSAIKKIQVTKKPTKMIYRDGESFQPDGMVVTATYANGTTRDITEYVKYDLTKITEKDHTVTITFPYVRYHNVENGTGMDAGITSTTPATTLSVVVGEPEMGDVNFDGAVDTIDAGLLVSYYYESVTLAADQLAQADVNEDGVVDTEDAGLIVSYYYGTVTSLGS